VSDFVLVKTFTSDFTKFCSLISVNFILFGVVSYLGELIQQREEYKENFAVSSRGGTNRRALLAGNSFE
jgi:hypothetical protein